VDRREARSLKSRRPIREPVRNEDLHGNAPDKARVALLLIDVINDLEFEGGDRLLEHALPMAERIAALRKHAQDHGIPTVYVNDNFGRWQSNFTKLIAHCRGDGVRGEPIVERLIPDEDMDYFVLKPKHSGFYSTTLDVLLDYLRVESLIITGLTTDYCVLFTAADAYMRDFELVVPSDCVASIDPENGRQALVHMRRVLRADTRASDAVELIAADRP
jgi:nicotinamidase-related amidase